MISLIFGENDFLRLEKVIELEKEYSNLEKVNGDNILIEDIVQIFSGLTLFDTEKRNILIRYLSDNKPVWDKFISLIEENSDCENNIFLLEAKLDKRTKDFKNLQKNTKVFEMKNLKNHTAVSKWLNGYIKDNNIKITPEAADEIIKRIGFNQAMIMQEIKKLSQLGEINIDLVKKYSEPAIDDDVFSTLKLAFSGNDRKLTEKINDLKFSHNPYEFVGLLSYQIWLMLAVFYGEKQGRDVAEIAKNLKVQPFSIYGVRSIVQTVNEEDIKFALERLSEVDEAQKTASTDGWTLIESALISIASTKK